MSRSSRDRNLYLMPFQCAFCANVYRISTANVNHYWFDPIYYVTSCCKILACDCCFKSDIARPGTLTCMLCSRKTVVHQEKKIGPPPNAEKWNRNCCAYARFYGSLFYEGWDLLIPFTATKKFGNWHEVMKIISWIQHPKYNEYREKYIEFVHDFYRKQKIFYLLHSKNAGILQSSAALVPTFFRSRPSMLDFFDTQKCYLNLVFRKRFLKQNQIGFIILISKRLSVLNMTPADKSLCSKRIFCRTFLSKKS